MTITEQEKAAIISTVQQMLDAYEWCWGDRIDVSANFPDKSATIHIDFKDKPT